MECQRMAYPPPPPPKFPLKPKPPSKHQLLMEQIKETNPSEQNTTHDAAVPFNKLIEEKILVSVDKNKELGHSAVKKITLG
ncbi:hypothetical protein TELCIR_21502 [Teladorsagia circumcincta]|uniref:Uncharacterized protein n=1 Tax=Teladorsagia circumcincta TaxID=45464 RepID=A0A2G9TGN1_TELCI|nr:hypothetical protein TELCIR_21502 [Teladorsagia circumcincta]